MTATTLPVKPESLAPSTRAATLGMPTSIDREARTMEMIITTSTRDRQGDVIEPAGLDFTNYLANPVILWAHDLSSPPVAKTLAITVGAEGVSAQVVFADTAFAREVFSLYADGFLNAWSIGFIPRRFERLNNEDTSPSGFRILEAEVVEISAVPVPANPEALTRELPKIKSYSLRKHLEYIMREEYAVDDKDNDSNSDDNHNGNALPNPQAKQLVQPSLQKNPCGCGKKSSSRKRPTVASGKTVTAITLDQCLTLADTLVTHLIRERVKSSLRQLRGTLA